MTSPFKVWDSQTLQENVKIAIQIKAKIEEICTENKVSPYSLPPSVVPTAQLFDIVSSYEALYNKLLEFSLAKTGNLKSSRKNIH